MFDIEGQGGFDVVLGNPPWERVKLQEREFFLGRDKQIESATKAATRRELISQLEKNNPVLWSEYKRALRMSEATSKFLRQSKRHFFTGKGDINTYSVFTETARDALSENGRVGLIVPSGIATDHTTKEFFADLSKTNTLVSLFDFENRLAYFPDVDQRMKFSLITLSGSYVHNTEFVFFANDIKDIRDEERKFSLAPSEIKLFNPNTGTMALFRIVDSTLKCNFESGKRGKLR